MKRATLFLLSAFIIASSLVSCLEEDEAAKIDNLFEKLDDQRFDKGRINEFIAAEKLKIENYQKMAEELEEHAQLTSALEAAEQSEDEAADYLRRKNESEVARAEEFKKWKEGQSERDEEAAKEALIQRMKDLQEEIYEREDAINIRLQEMKAWKSKASNMELEASRERNDDRARKLERLADLARDKALALSDENSDSWIVVGRLKGELQDLKRIGIR